MKIKAVVTATLVTFSLTSCSAWIHGNKALANDSENDQQVSTRVVDGRMTLRDVNQTFGESVKNAICAQKVSLMVNTRWRNILVI
ncbi:hypothetical protein ACT474_001083 [Cronobacter malonaticus]